MCCKFAVKWKLAAIVQDMLLRTFFLSFLKVDIRIMTGQLPQPKPWNKVKLNEKCNVEYKIQLCEAFERFKSSHGNCTKQPASLKKKKWPDWWSDGELMILRQLCPLADRSFISTALHGLMQGSGTCSPPDVAGLNLPASLIISNAGWGLDSNRFPINKMSVMLSNSLVYPAWCFSS